MDHRGGIRGTVRGANNAPVADTAVTAVDATTGARFEATTDAQGAYAFGALPVGNYNITVVVGRPDRVPAPGRGGDGGSDRAARHHPRRRVRAQAAEAERQELLQQVATLEQRITDLESSTVLSEPETRVRRVEVFVDAERRRARRAGSGREAGRHLPARARLSPADDQREDRRSAGRRRGAQRDGRRRCGDRDAVRQAHEGRRSAGRQPRLRAGVGRPVLHRRASPRTRSSSPTSSA